MDHELEQLIGGVLHEGSLEENAHEIALLSNAYPELHAAYLHTFQYGIDLAHTDKMKIFRMLGVPRGWQITSEDVVLLITNFRDAYLDAYQNMKSSAHP